MSAQKRQFACLPHNAHIHLSSGSSINREKGLLLGFDLLDGQFACDLPLAGDIANVRDVLVRVETIRFRYAGYLVFLHIVFSFVVSDLDTVHPRLSLSVSAD